MEHREVQQLVQGHTATTGTQRLPPAAALRHSSERPLSKEVPWPLSRHTAAPLNVFSAQNQNGSFKTEAESCPFCSNPYDISRLPGLWCSRPSDLALVSPLILFPCPLPGSLSGTPAFSLTSGPPSRLLPQGLCTCSSSPMNAPSQSISVNPHCFRVSAAVSFHETLPQSPCLRQHPPSLSTPSS